MFNVMSESISSLHNSNNIQSDDWLTCHTKHAMYTTNHIKNVHVLFTLWYPRNLKEHAHFFDLISSCFNFQVASLYFPLLSIVTNASLLSELESDLPITTLNPNLTAHVQIHWSIWSNIQNYCSFVNDFSTSKWTSLDLTSINAITLVTTSGFLITTTNETKDNLIHYWN